MDTSAVQRKVDVRESVRTVTSNLFVCAGGLSEISLKARKLLYVAISQCKREDHGFYEYSISVQEFARLMDIDPSNLYQEADKITDELMRGYITVSDGTGDFERYSLFSKCEYRAGSVLKFKLNNDMTDFLLALKGNFTQPLLSDFLHMNSPYSMAIWHLMQREMKSQKPGLTDEIEFDLSLRELKSVTNTLDKKAYDKISNFKNKILDKALREINDNCGVEITYENIKTGRSVTGFHFRAISPYHVDISTLPPEVLEKAEQIKHRVSGNR